MQAASAQKNQDPPDEIFLKELLTADSGFLAPILEKKDEYRVQIIYTRIDRRKSGAPIFTDHFFNTDSALYFYPASTVKLPVAILALQKLNELAIPGLDKYTTMITGSAGDGQTEVYNDPSSTDGRPSIAHYIKKILLVSDNDAFNRLYEFLGQDYINSRLHQMGYTDVQIIHRLSISLTDQQNRHSNPVRFIDTTGRIIYEKPAEQSSMNYRFHNTRIGKGFIRGGQLVSEPFDFSLKNRMTLNTLHQVLRSIMFPEAVSRQQRFNLTGDDYAFLRRYMSMNPRESTSPVYDTLEYWDNYVRMVLYGVEKVPPEPSIRIFNKCGWSYGFLTDAAYIADFRNKVEFMVSAVIYCNSDGILNDDQYDYHSLGYPFLKQLGRTLYEYELNRERRRRPDLDDFKFSYLP